MKFAARDRGTARTLIRTAPGPNPTDPTRSRFPSFERRGDGRFAVLTAAPYSRDSHGDGHSRGESESVRQARDVNFTFLRGQRLFGPTEAAGLFYVVRGGCVRLYKTLPDGRSINLGLLGPNTIFTQEDRTDGLATGLTAEALVDTTVSVIEQDDLAAMIGQSPELAAALVEGMTRRLTSLQTLVEQILARDVTVRLATMLLTLAERFGRPMPDGLHKIALPVPHQLLANMIGSNRVTVTRKLSELRAAGLTRALGRNLIAVDPVKLHAFVQASARPATPEPAEAAD
ncbi:MAG: Crp/Fnr family transcriptional regulator [Thermomicrobiales bacterium]